MSRGIKKLSQQPDAGFWLRVVAKLLDDCLLSFAGAIIISLGVWLNALGMSVWIILFAVVMTSVLKYIYIYCMTLTRGQTVGKIFAGIRVETAEGNLPKAGQLARRVIIEMVFDPLIVLGVLLALRITQTMELPTENFRLIITGYVIGQFLAWADALAVAFTIRRQAIHDLVAHTYVVRIREGSRVKLWVVAGLFNLLLNPTILLRQYIMEAHYIPSESMSPTLNRDDRIVTNKLTMKKRMPKYGDIITFMHGDVNSVSNKPVMLIKRVVGLPGDQLQVKEGCLYRNGQAIDEPYIAEPMRYTWPEDAAQGGVIKIPPGNIVVMGDNRNNSNDAHLWRNYAADGKTLEATPFLPVKDIKGIMIFRYWPADRIGPVNNLVQ